MTTADIEGDACRFCAMGRGDAGLFGTNPFLPQDLRVPLASDSVFAIADAAPLSRFHVLIAPFQHHLSYAAAPRSIRLAMFTLAESIAKASDSGVHGRQEHYVFEHGSTAEHEAIGCATAHAHTHVVADHAGLLSRKEMGYGPRRFASWDEALARSPDQAYYLLGSIGGEFHVADHLEPAALQCNMYLRKHFAALQGQPELANYQRYQVAGAESDDLCGAAMATHDLLQQLSR